MSTHVNLFVSRCFYQLVQNKSCRRALPLEAAKTRQQFCCLDSTSLQFSRCWQYVVSIVHRCNSLVADSMLSAINKLQRVLNAVGNAICGRNKRDHVTPLIWDKLRWPRIPERIIYKLSANIYKATQKQASQYVADFCRTAALVASRSSLQAPCICQTSTRSSHTYEVWGSQLCYRKTVCLEQPTIGGVPGWHNQYIQRKVKNICLASATSDNTQILL